MASKDLEEQIRRFDVLMEYIEKQLPLKAQAIAGMDLVAMVAHRVVQDGKDSKGQSFSAYSDIQIEASEFIGKSRVASVDAKIKAMAKKKQRLSYKQFREMNNLEIAKKNFEFTGEMWRKFGIVNFTINGQNFKIKIGGTTEAAQKKIDENSYSENESIIEATEEERQWYEKTLNDWLNAETNRLLNGG